MAYFSVFGFTDRIRILPLKKSGDFNAFNFVAHGYFFLADDYSRGRDYDRRDYDRRDSDRRDSDRRDYREDRYYSRPRY